MGPLSLILLDRDGVINEDLPEGVRRKEDFLLFPLVAEAISRLNKAKVPVGVVTNQALVERGALTLEGLDQIHFYLQDLLRPFSAKIDHFFVCSDAFDSPRRKPAPGMLYEAFSFFKKSPHEALMVGDALRDLEAAKAAGCFSALVRTGKGQKTLDEGISPHLLPWKTFNDLFDVVDFLFQENLLLIS